MTIPDDTVAASMKRNERRFSLVPTPEVLGRIDETLKAVQPAEEIRRPDPWAIGQTRVIKDLAYEYDGQAWIPVGPAQPGAAPVLCSGGCGIAPCEDGLCACLAPVPVDACCAEWLENSLEVPGEGAGWRCPVCGLAGRMEMDGPRIWNPGDSPVLPPVPESAYPPGAAELPVDAAVEHNPGSCRRCGYPVGDEVQYCAPCNRALEMDKAFAEKVRELAAGPPLVLRKRPDDRPWWRRMWSAR